MTERSAPAAPRRPRGAAGGRGYGATLVLGLVSAGAVSLGVSRPWVTAHASAAGLPVLSASVDGGDVAPLAGALGFVLLAAFGAVIATRGRVRRALGLLIGVAAVLVVVSVVHPGDTTAAVEQGLSAKGWTRGPYDAATSPWRWLVGLGGLGCLLTGLTVARFGGCWPSMGARYDAPSATSRAAEADPAPTATETDLWRSIDSGHDPTQGP